MQEKRRCHRFNIELPVWFKSCSVGDDMVAIASTMDISATGMSFVAKEELEKGQELLLQVKLPSDETLTVKTRVIWIREDFGAAIREYRVGLQVVEPVRNDESKFVKFVAAQMIEFYKGKDPLGFTLPRKD